MKEYLICTMSVGDLADLGMNGTVPEDWKFTTAKGKTLYDEVGGAWRERSENTIYLCQKDAPESKYRWMHPDTIVEIYKVDQ
jgi:hypothetical protein